MFFLLLNPLNVQSKNSGGEFYKYFDFYLLVRRLPKTEIKRDWKKNIFYLIENQENTVGDYLELYCYYSYYINKKQKLVVMYLELIFTGIKVES